MLYDGISITGSYHAKNQDSFGFCEFEKGFALVVSDGLGSKSNSKLGSQYLCDCVVEIIKKYDSGGKDFEINEFIEMVHVNWLKKLTDFIVSLCYATMLFVVYFDNEIFAVRLGDGFISLKFDNRNVVLKDEKSDYFANETDCMSEILNIEKFNIYKCRVTKLEGIILCSDGVEIGNMTEEDISTFTNEFILGYHNMSKNDISQDINEWLSDWTGSDDKTLVYLLAREEKTDD